MESRLQKDILITNFFDILDEVIGGLSFETLYISFVEEQLFQKERFDKFM
jgi:hypothetical protein